MTLRDEAEAFLAADPRVAAFSIAEADDALHATATAAPVWLVEQRAAAYDGLCSRIVKQWQMVYDRSYRWDQNVRAPNFDAWISGFTNAAIPIERMQIWLDDALAQMRSVPHARVLDIGCGVGLVLAALAPGGTVYDGLDVSEEAVASLGAWVATQPALAHVRLVQRAAHELDGLERGGADLAVLNSVVQYFPGPDYLVTVLKAAAERIAPGGAIFLGDLRAAALLPMRAANVAAAHASPDATAGEVRKEADAILALARELAIDPGFFDTLGAVIPRLGGVTFSLKPVAADHELSGYRYDAMLRFDAPAAAQAPIMAPIVAANGLDALLALLARLDGERPEAVAILGVANARLARDAALAHALEAAPAETKLADILGAIEDDSCPVEPHALAQGAATRGYAAELRFTPGAPDGRFDALLRRTGVEARWPDGEATQAPRANDPLGAELAAKLRRDLQRDLDKALGGPGRARLELTG